MSGVVLLVRMQTSSDAPSELQVNTLCHPAVPVESDLLVNLWQSVPSLNCRGIRLMMSRTSIMGCAAALLVAAVHGCAMCRIGHGADDPYKWLVTLHQNGEETARAVIPLANKLHSELDELCIRCGKQGRVDLNSYAPSIRIESDLERIDLRAKTIVVSTRKGVDQAWSQKSLPANANDKKLRQRILDYVKGGVAK